MASVLIVVIVGFEAAWRASRRSPPSIATERVETVLLIALVITIAGGLGLLAGRGRPRELLHFAYAVVALGALPIADSLTRQLGPRARGVSTLLAAVVTLVVIVRLFDTG